MEDYWRVRYRARAGTSSLKSNRDPLPRFYCQAGNHPPQGNVDLHSFQHGGLPTLCRTLLGNGASIAPVPTRKGSRLIAPRKKWPRPVGAPEAKPDVGSALIRRDHDVGGLHHDDDPASGLDAEVIHCFIGDR